MNNAPDTSARGFTLVEMLIVLAVLATVAALSWPAMARMSRRSRLEDAAASVRAELGRARLEAIESGTARRFRFEPGGRRFEVAAHAVAVGGDRELFGSFGSTDDDRRLQSPATDESSLGESTLVELDDGIYFATEQFTTARSGEGFADETTGPQGWSAPIVFYPNGRTLNAHFLLTDGRDYYVEITLRGLTGSAAVGPVMVHPREETP